MILDNMLLGLTNVFTMMNIMAICVGSLLGLAVGAMPGLSGTMAIALLVPITYVIPPDTGICMLASLYLSSLYGGSIAAILIRTPGTASAAATVMDGFPMAQKGQASKALSISLTASFVGGLSAASRF